MQESNKTDRMNEEYDTGLSNEEYMKASGPVPVGFTLFEDHPEFCAKYQMLQFRRYLDSLS